MMSLKVNSGSRFPEVVHLPGSKSYANRVLVLAALSEKSFTVQNLPESTDVTWLLSALRKCRLQVEENKNSVTIHNFFPQCEKGPQEIEVGEGGTTARFLASMLLLGTEAYTLILGERLKDRPWEEFINFVRLYGGRISLNGDRLRIQGPLRMPKEVRVDASRTTQFASGLRLAFFKQGVRVRPVGLNSSQSYWEMTEKLIAETSQENSFSIPLDWSSASYPLAYGALHQEIHFPKLTFDSFQSDVKFLTLLKELQAVEIDEQGVRVRPFKLHKSVALDVSDCLDLVPTLGYFLSHVEGQHRLSGIQNLIHKESDRLSEVIKLLQLFGRKAWVKDGELRITGTKEIINEERNLILPHDHRMVMVGALFLAHHGGGTLAPWEAVDKSFPGFFDYLR
jgi:3-phosphoshikimate 1-carboxyvinyltransferase